jgi:phosphoglycolate phosphatase-like HAD superfamily hydrolase
MKGIKMRKYVVFDIDGTLADISHRRHYVASKPKNWPAFNAAMAVDTPKPDVITMLMTMYNSGYTIVIASGRDEQYRDVTVQWLKKYIPSYMIGNVYMRKNKDCRPDNIVKSEFLDHMIQMYGEGHVLPTFVFDDRDSVVAMWRSRGITCFQVDYGNF